MKRTFIIFIMVSLSFIFFNCAKKVPVKLSDVNYDWRCYEGTDFDGLHKKPRDITEIDKIRYDELFREVAIIGQTARQYKYLIDVYENEEMKKSEEITTAIDSALIYIFNDTDKLGLRIEEAKNNLMLLSPQEDFTGLELTKVPQAIMNIKYMFDDLKISLESTKDISVRIKEIIGNKKFIPAEKK